MLTDWIGELRHQLPPHATQLRTALTGPVRVVHLGGHWPGRAVYAVFARPGPACPAVVLKVDRPPAPEGRLNREWEFMSRAATIPAMTGRMAQPLALWQSGQAQILAQSGLAGVPLMVALRRRRRPGYRSSAREHAMFLDWLSALHSGTTTPDASTVLEPETFADQLDRALPQELPRRAIVLGAAATAGRRVGRLHVPTRRLHGDPGPSNCLVSRGRLGVIDWEGTSPEGPPLAEMLLFLDHYARAVPLSAPKLLPLEDAFRRAFIGDDWLGQLTQSTWNRYLVELGLPPKASHYLLLRTLTDLAVGQAPTAHATRPGARKNWTALLAIYAAATSNR